MAKWDLLILSRNDGHPAPRQLVALSKAPKDNPFHPQYDIGYFDYDPLSQSRKLWWLGTNGCENIAELKKHYYINWYPIPSNHGLPERR